MAKITRQRKVKIAPSDPGETVGRGKNYLLAIGIDAYQHAPPLHNAVKDAREFVKLLIGRYQFDSAQVVTLFDQDATRRRVLSELKKLVRRIRPVDNLILYYSGHGLYDKDLDQGYWVPIEARLDFDTTADFISNDEIVRYIRSIKSQHTLLIVDSCFSGTLFARVRSVGVTRLENLPSRWALTSGRQEPVLDGQPGMNSPFSEALLEYLRQNSKPNLLVSELIQYVKQSVGNNHEQIPAGNPLQNAGDKGGEFVFHLKKDEKRAWQICRQENSIATYRLFLAQFPDGEYAAEARQKLTVLEEEAAWDIAEEEQTILGYDKYLRTYPEGKHAPQALEAIRLLEEEQAWKHAKNQDTIYAYRTYTRKYPLGKYKAEADDCIRAKLNRQPVATVEELTDDQEPEAPRKTPGSSLINWLAFRQYGWRGIGFLLLLLMGTWGVWKMWPSTEEPGLHERTTLNKKGSTLLDTSAVNTQNEKDTTLQGLSPTFPPPKLSQEWPGNDRLIVTVSEGRVPYQFKLIRSNQILLTRTIDSPGKQIVEVADYRQDPGLYLVQVEDANQLNAVMEIDIDVPKGENSITLAGQTYRTVKLKGRNWLAENLNYKMPRGSWCYENLTANCIEYGQLYTWEAAQLACQALGEGWRLPANQEWREIAQLYGGIEEDAKDSGKAAYEALIKGGRSSFSVHLAGWRSSYGGFAELQNSGSYWSREDDDAASAWGFRFHGEKGVLYRDSFNKRMGFSCRCVKN